MLKSSFVFRPMCSGLGLFLHIGREKDQLPVETKHKIRGIKGSDAEEAKEEMNTRHNYR